MLSEVVGGSEAYELANNPSFEACMSGYFPPGLGLLWRMRDHAVFTLLGNPGEIAPALSSVKRPIGNMPLPLPSSQFLIRFHDEVYGGWSSLPLSVRKTARSQVW